MKSYIYLCVMNIEYVNFNYIFWCHLQKIKLFHNILLSEMC